MVSITALASSSAGCCYLLESNRAGRLLVDAGLSLKAIAKKLNYTVSTLAGCLISHAHGDHCKAVIGLLGYGVDVYATEETWNAIGNGRRHHRAKQIGQLHEFMVGKWNVKAFDVVHDCEGTVGFLITDGVARILYLTDTAYSKYRFDGLTHIMVEANHSSAIMRERARGGSLKTDRYKRTSQNHMSIERLVDMLKANDLSKCEAIYLLHLSDGNSDDVAFKEQVQKATGVPVYVMAKGGN